SESNFSPRTPPPPPCSSSSSSSVLLLLIPQGLGALTFLSFRAQRTIASQLFIRAARSFTRSVCCCPASARTRVHELWETIVGVFKARRRILKGQTLIRLRRGLRRDL
ncbi:hypothetical protein ATANTOWER_011031, partial [Ataeniobius toweri]|nr:hypothetical protein [Ataeniobius toweri]